MLRTYSNLDSFVGKVRAFGTVVFPYRGMLHVTRAFVSMELSTWNVCLNLIMLWKRLTFR